MKILTVVKLLLLVILIFNGCNLDKYIEKIARKKLVPQFVNNKLNFDERKKIQNVLTLDTIIDVNIQIEGLDISPPYLVSFEKRFYWGLIDTANNSFKILTYDPKFKKLDTLIAKYDTADFNEVKKKFPYLNVISFDINREFLAIRITQEHIMVFSFESNKIKYLFTLTISVGKEVYLKSDTLFCVDLTYSVDENFSPTFAIVLVDLRKPDLIEIKNLKFEYPEFLLYKPSKYYSFSPNRALFLVSEPLSPIFKILTNLSQENELIDTNEFWINFRSPYYDSIRTLNLVNFEKGKKRIQPKDFILKLESEFKSKPGSKIISAQFISDSVFFVSYTAGLSNEKDLKVVYCDIWQKNTFGWKKKYFNLLDYFPNAKAKCSKDNFYFLSGYFIPKFDDEFVASFQISPPSEIIFDTTLTYEKIFENRDEFFSEQGLFWQLYVYKWKLNWK